tara:strand:- start:94 stop:288 length:195 start_codon:yes stop_codon:yes gene_type:complete
MYEVFHRTWWRINPDWPDGLEPHAGRKSHMAYAATEEIAQYMCKEYNDNHKPGQLSRKAEYDHV